MATLIYSDKCQYSAQAIKSIQENPALLHIVRFHNVSTGCTFETDYTRSDINDE